MAWARELSLTGNFIGAETALRIGLVNHVLPHERLVPFALELAHAVAQQDPGMVELMRRDWDETAGRPITEARRIHEHYGASAGFRTSHAADLAARHAAVLERSRNQRAVAQEDG